MKKPTQIQSVERLFSFVLRARILIVGRDSLARSKNKLQFVLIVRDLSDISRRKILSDFAHVPVVEHYTMKDLKVFFGISGAKVIGFEKSSLARSLYAELKKYRINQPANGGQPIQS